MDVAVVMERLDQVFDSYEVYIEKEKVKKYEATEGDILGVELKEEEGVAVRGIKEGKMVFSYTFEKGEKGLSALIENGRILLPHVEKDTFSILPPRYDEYPDLSLYDEEGLKISDESKVSALVEMESLIRGFDRRIATTRNCEFNQMDLEVRVLNSHGLDVTARKTLYTLGALAVAADGEEVSWYDWSWSSRYQDLDGQSLGRKIAEKAVSFLHGEMLTTGLYDGLLTPAAACQMLEILSPSFLSENLQKNKTRLKEKTGSRCFSDCVTITDSGSKGMGAFPFDGEGVPSRENVVVKAGVFEGFLYDSYYGNRLSHASSGNAARAGVKEPPRCAPRGFYVGEGPRDLVGGFDSGIVIEELMGTHTANTVTGDFSVGALGHSYSGGTRTPFNGVIFSGNIFELLSQVKAVGNDLRFYGSYGSPTLYIEGLKISGK